MTGYHFTRTLRHESRDGEIVELPTLNVMELIGEDDTFKLQLSVPDNHFENLGDGEIDVVTSAMLRAFQTISEWIRKEE